MIAATIQSMRMNYEQLTREEEQELFARWAESKDQKARERIILGVAPFMIKMVRRYSGAMKVPVEELVQEGYVALTIAFDKFDHTKGVRFITYANHWVKALVLDFNFRMNGPVKFGTTRSERDIYYRLPKAYKELSRDGEITSERLTEYLGVTREALDRVTTRYAQRDTSIDVLQSFSDGSVGDAPLPKALRALTVVDEDPVERIDMERFSLDKWKDVIDARSMKILRWTFYKNLTLAAVGKKLGISRERVRQLRDRALRKIRKVEERA